MSRVPALFLALQINTSTQRITPCYRILSNGKPFMFPKQFHNVEKSTISLSLGIIDAVS